MSNRPLNPKLIQIAKVICRRLRRRQTHAEELLWAVLRNRQFHDLKFYRQHPLFVEIDGKETFYVADFFCHERKAVIELDGLIHRFQQEKDSRRDATIREHGIRVIRFSNDAIEKDLENILHMLTNILDL